MMRATFSTTSLLLFASMALGGCDGQAADVASGAATPAKPSSASAEVTASATQAWERQLVAEVSRIEREQPGVVADFRALEPRRTRPGFPRFTGESIRRPEMAALMLDRLRTGRDEAAVRAALVEALPRTGGTFAPTLLELLEREDDASVRAVMMASLRTADAESAHAGLSKGLEDRDPAVRAAALRTLERRQDARALAPRVLSLVSDPDPEVQKAAMHAAGVLRLSRATSALETGLGHDDPELRLQALRALQRIDERHAASLSRTRALQADPDARVSKLAAALTR